MREQVKTQERKVNRAQMFWRSVDGVKLVAEDRPARAIWEFVGRRPDWASTRNAFSRARRCGDLRPSTRSCWSVRRWTITPWQTWA